MILESPKRERLILLGAGNLSRHKSRRTAKASKPLPGLAPSAVPTQRSLSSQPLSSPICLLPAFSRARSLALLLIDMWRNSLNSKWSSSLPVILVTEQAGVAVRTKRCAKTLHKACIRLCTLHKARASLESQSPLNPLTQPRRTPATEPLSSRTSHHRRSPGAVLHRLHRGLFSGQRNTLASSVALPDQDVVWMPGLDAVWREQRPRGQAAVPSDVRPGYCIECITSYCGCLAGTFVLEGRRVFLAVQAA